jgi:hypothetical protein
MKWNPGGWMSGLKALPGQIDESIRQQAQGRALLAQRAGRGRNREFFYRQPADVVAARMVNDGATSGFTGGLGQDDLAALLANQANRRAVARSVVPQLNRGPMGIGQMGVMEAINTGIATNPLARRVALPVAIGVGGGLATAGVTSAGQGLLQLMGFMQQGQQTAQAREESPLIQQA